MFLIVGLGNPGKEYDGTRHNIGFAAVDYIADKYNLNFEKKLNYYIRLFALKCIYFFFFNRDKFEMNKAAFRVCVEFKRNIK